MRLVALALSSAALINVSARPWMPGYLAWTAFIPLLFVLGNEYRLSRGALAGFMASLGIGVAAFEGVAPAELWIYPILVILASIPFALAGLGMSWTARSLGRTYAVFCFPIFWLAAEYLPAQRWLLGDFANGMSAIGYTQFDTPLRALAGWSSVSAVSLALMLINLALYLLLRRTHLVSACALLVFVLGVTIIPVPGTDVPAEDNPAEPLSVALIQGAVSSIDSLMARFDRAAAIRMLEPYAELTALAAERNVDLVVWGETVLPQAVRPGHVPDYVAEALGPAPAALVGGVSFVEGSTFNSAFYWEDGDLTEVYRKRALVPFNEAHYTPGIALPPLDVNGTALGIGICLESVFPSLARESVHAGAEALAYLTEDSFAAQTVMPELHLRVTAFRAIETGRYALFVNQSGPSAVFSQHGDVLHRIDHGEAAGVLATLTAYAGLTPFVRFGDWLGAIASLAVLSLIVSHLMALAGARIKHRRHDDTGALEKQPSATPREHS